MANGAIQHIGLKYASDEYPLVIPVFTKSDEILSYSDTSGRLLYPTLDTDVLTVESNATYGKLKGLLISRGNTVANYTTSDEETGNYLIPKIQQKFDTLVNSVVTLLNDAVSPLTGEKPADLNGNRTGLEIFVRNSGYDRETQPEDPDVYASLYTTDNISVNPDLLESAGYNLLCLSPSGDPGDTDLLNEISTAWKDGVEKLGNLSVDDYYNKIITDIGVEIEEARNNSEVQSDVALTTDNERQKMSGVSIDEELTNMLKYQYAYQSAAKLLNVIDSMIDKIVNQMV
jgi:flagellar hook-associated protein 1 FlgK